MLLGNKTKNKVLLILQCYTGIVSQHYLDFPEKRELNYELENGFSHSTNIY
jgi:hypothetical protein